MFVPVPPNSDQTPADPPVESEPEPVVALTRLRPVRRGRWPALIRLSLLLRLIALVHLIIGIPMGLVCLASAILGSDHARVAMLLTSVSAFISAVVGYILFHGLAEGILLLIAMERSLRQTRDRIADPRTEEDLPSRGELEL
jgi:hypothetical protein